METRNITLTLDKAKEFYNSGNTALKEIALQAFTEQEITVQDFECIKTFEDACKAVCIDIADFNKMLKGFYGVNIFNKNRASIAAIKLNIIRQALNKGKKMELTKGDIYYPYIPFVTKSSTYYNSEINRGEMFKVAKFRANNEEYILLGGNAAYGSAAGLGGFHSHYGVGYSFANVGFLGCASRDIAKHMGRYFAKEIFEAMYGDFIDFEWTCLQ